MGMSAEEFWHGDPNLARSYREAYKMSRENADRRAWEAGVYVFQAMVAASPAFHEFSKSKLQPEYPKHPLFAAAPPKEERQEEADKARMMQMMAWVKAMADASNEKRRDGEEKADC